MRPRAHVAVHDRQRALAVGREGLRRLAAWLMDRCFPPRRGGWESLSVVITGDAGIAAINRRHRGHAGATDVISFRFAAVPGDDGVHGEVVINAVRAAAVGPRHGGVAHELALYLAHGCDHLTGADDADPAARRRMRRRELRWLRAAAHRGLLRGLATGRARRR